MAPKQKSPRKRALPAEAPEGHRDVAGTEVQKVITQISRKTLSKLVDVMVMACVDVRKLGHADGLGAW